MTHRLEGSLWLSEGGQQATQRIDNNGDLLPPRLPPPRTPTITDSPNTGIMRRMLYRNNIHIRKLSKFLALLHDDLHWLDVPQRVQYKLCATVHRCLQHKAPPYTANCCIHTSDIARRQHLRSAGCHQPFVPRHWQSMPAFSEGIFRAAVKPLTILQLT